MITLTTDFGDGMYAGALRGSILGIHPAALVVDVTHAVPPQDVVAGALTLYATLPYFPDGAVHVAVVDPGVGTERRGLLVETRHGLLVGPDNGLLVPAAERLGLEQVRVLENPDLWRHPVSATFHGRDVFGPVAAHLARGVPPGDVGPETEEFVRLDFGRPEPVEGGLVGRVLMVDAFGNVVLNVPENEARGLLEPGDRVDLAVGNARLAVPFARTFGDVPPGEAILYVGSSGFLELGVHRGSAARTFGVREGMEARLNVPR